MRTALRTLAVATLLALPLATAGCRTIGTAVGTAGNVAADTAQAAGNLAATAVRGAGRIVERTADAASSEARGR